MTAHSQEAMGEASCTVYFAADCVCPISQINSRARKLFKSQPALQIRSFNFIPGGALVKHLPGYRCLFVFIFLSCGRDSTPLQTQWTQSSPICITNECLVSSPVIS